MLFTNIKTSKYTNPYGLIISLKPSSSFSGGGVNPHNEHITALFAKYTDINTPIDILSPNSATKFGQKDTILAKNLYHSFQISLKKGMATSRA